MPEPATGGTPFQARELLVRGLSAVVLGAITLLATWSGPIPFAILAACVSSVLVWEWGRLTRRIGIDAAAAAGGLSILAAIVLMLTGQPALALAMLALGAGVTLLVGGRQGGLLEAVGVLYAGLPSLALVWLRLAPHGWEAVLLLLLIVWATDTGAFVSGRLLGGPRLWTSVSPNKTWTGLLGGVASAGLIAWVTAQLMASPLPGRVAALAIVLAVLSQVGDLFESALKRAHGVKDTSALIPGHGGFMDRLDGLIFAAVGAALFALVADRGNPGAALLGL